jgi:hypothetical protein
VCLRCAASCPTPSTYDGWSGGVVVDGAVEGRREGGARVFQIQNGGGSAWPVSFACSGRAGGGGGVATVGSRQVPDLPGGGAMLLARGWFLWL